MNIRYLWINDLKGKEFNIDATSLIEPDPVIFSFEAIGWKILIVCVSIVFSLLLGSGVRKYYLNRYRRKAVKQMGDLKSKSKGNSEAIYLFHRLLKKIAIQAYGRKKVANLHGTEWLQFLDTTMKSSVFVQHHESYHSAVYNLKELSDEMYKEMEWIVKKWLLDHDRQF